MKKILSFQFFFFLFVIARSQAPAQVMALNADSVKVGVSLIKYAAVFIDSSGKMNLSQVAAAAFIPLNQWDSSGRVHRTLVAHKFYLRFTVINTDPASKKFYHYPGKLFDKMNLYHRTGNGFTKIETDRFHGGFLPINIGAGQTKEYLIQLKFFKTGLNKLDPRLISSAHFESYKKELFGSLNNKKTVGILLSGMLLMMILVTLLNYFISQKIEFFYNSAYSLCMFLIIFLTTYLTMNPSWVKGFFISYVDLFLLVAGTNCYLAFTRHFLDTPLLHPRLNKLLKSGTLVTAGLMTIFTLVFFFDRNYQYEIYIENGIKIILMIFALLFIFLAITRKSKLLNYLALGVGTQVAFSLVSLFFALTKSSAEYIYNSPIFYFELGIICSIVFFLLGLFYKNRQELIIKIKEQEAMKLEVEKQSFENKLTVYKTQQEERNRISADMHDDLGAGMTTIRLYSELAKAKLNNQPVPELDKISSSADELINNMNAIIWSMSSDNDSFGNMIAYIRSYAIDYLENTGIKPFVTIPERLPELVVNGTIRRNIFLVIKEALQNVVKHSQASEVILTMSKEPEGFALLIHDNGKGIDFENMRPYSNGLKNMRKRMEDIHFDFTIENNNGTRIRMYAKTR